MGELHVDPEGLRSGAARVTVSADELAAPIEFMTAGEQPSHRALENFATALNAARADAARFMNWQSQEWHRSGNAFEENDHVEGRGFDGLRS